ncbi:hypothetical protein ACRALDRAFT_210198 [Sodiomyces alcalophilus JCM 7366]|uniref:uncharacterized protein n=1 Tax=Sodiomyces alcalophilus JCM 7366 TaxID=591952 RepID=UPI0039B5B12C
MRDPTKTGVIIVSLCRHGLRPPWGGWEWRTLSCWVHSQSHVTHCSEYGGTSIGCDPL